MSRYEKVNRRLMHALFVGGLTLALFTACVAGLAVWHVAFAGSTAVLLP